MAFHAPFPTGLLGRNPDAYAQLRGGPQYPELRGLVTFYQLPAGVYLTAVVQGLPDDGGNCAPHIFALHIHDGSSCTGDTADPFANTGGHYNPGGCPHPAHAGDLPPLFANRGFALMSVFTARFRAEEILGKTVVVHARPDDFTTQPSGNAGAKIACGRIEAFPG